MQLTWLTQGSFLLETDSFRLAIDPYLSDIVEQKEGLTRLTPPPLNVAQLRPNMVFSTHDHLDHLDPVAIPQIAQQWPECRFAGPPTVVKHLQELGLQQGRAETAAEGDRLRTGPFELTATRAYHGAEAVGLLVSDGDHKLYISGDSLYRDDLAASVKQAAESAIDVVIICINGRWGNMNVEEALKVVGFLKPKVAIPMHYGLFAENNADPVPFLAGCKEHGIKGVALTVGRKMEVAELLPSA